jgi:hypothetical protein
MRRRTDPRKLEQFAELRSRGKTVTQASKAMKINERTGWRWNAQIGLRDRNPEPEPVKRAGKVLSTPSEPEPAKLPGVPADPDPPTWVEEVQEPQLPFDSDALTAISDGPRDKPEPVLPFPTTGTFDERWAWLRENNAAPSRENAGSGANPVVTRAGEGMNFPGSSNVGAIDTPDAHEAARGYRSPSAKRIHPHTGEDLDQRPRWQRQVPDPRFSISPPKRSMRGYWLNGPN